MKSYNNAIKSILSIVLNHGSNAFEEASRHIDTKHFLQNKYRVIWNAYKWIYEDETSINKTSVMKCLEAQKDSDGNQNIKYLSSTGKYEEVLSSIKSFALKDTLSDIETYVRIILDEYVVAKNNEMCSRVMAEKTAGNQIKIIDEYADIWHEADIKSFKTISEIMGEMATEAESGISSHNNGIRTSLPFLSEHLVMTPGNITVIAGDTSHGKSSLAIQLIADVASQKVTLIDEDTHRPALDENFNEVQRDRIIVLFSLEMDEKEFASKLFCNAHNMSIEEMRALSDKEFAKFARQVQAWMAEKMPNLIIESGDFSLNDCKKKIAIIKSRYKHIDLVVFDHIGLLSDIHDHMLGDEHQRYKYCSRQAKMKIAVKLHTHCILLSQLNKAQTDKFGKTNHLPSVDRLFGSSGIKQDASNIIFIYREHAISPPIDATNIVISNRAVQIKTYFITRIMIAKSRFGSITTAKPVGFIPYIQKIVPLQKIHEWELLQSDDPNLRLTKEQFAQIN